MKIINILDINDRYYISGPSEFIYLEQHAKLICTDSFYSCVFGIIMNTPFIVFEREDKSLSINSRLEILMEKFNLNDRRYSGKLVEKDSICDYSKCDEILKNEIKNLKKF